MVQAIPDGQRTVTAHLTFPDANKAIDCKIMHAELVICDSRLYVNDAFGRTPPVIGDAVTINIWTEDADALYNRAVEAGASKVFPLQNQFWGDRYGKFKDPFGYTWGVSQHVEDLTPEEIDKRSESFFSTLETQLG